jgi:hypothetical protein
MYTQEKFQHDKRQQSRKKEENTDAQVCLAERAMYINIKPVTSF